MARYAQGQPVTISTEVRLPPVPPATVGVLTTPGSILLRVKKPDGTFLADYAAPVADATGKYHVDIPSADLATLGHYQYAWITAGTAAGVSPPAAFEVVDPFAPTHVTLADAKARLQLDLPTVTANAPRDEELQAMIASAVTEQENRVGAVAPRIVTETLTASGGLLRPTTRPVLAVTSATLGGVAQVVSGWQVNSGSITPGVGSAGFSGTYVVTYTAGRNPVPQDLVEAALLRVEAAYDTQRGPAGVPLAVEQDSGFGSSYPLLLRAKDKEALYFTPGSA